MDIKDLKSAWNTYSSQEVDKHRLGKESIHELLEKRSKTMVERFNRNIKIGMFVLGLYVCYVLWDFVFLSTYFSRIFNSELIEYPKWLNVLDVFSTALIITTYFYFVIRFIRIKRSFSPDTHLKDLLTGILDIIKTYRRMFYLTVTILLINMILSFAAGLYQGVKFNADAAGKGIENLSTSHILSIIGVGLAILIPFIAITFFLLRWGFNRLYGRYQIRLNETLQELDETGDFE